MKTEMNPQIYLVGGAVRDLILGNIPKDFDYVVVGASPEWMLERGYKQVGAAFPVFLHPENGSEYALARREKKVAAGYHGFEVEFSPDVTLEEDLSRRDLTINSIAMSHGNQYIDPFNGMEDLKNGIIRHVSDAFAEDPLRVMRVARFAARYGFLIHSDTIELCRNLVNAGELDALSADRIWGELEKLFSEKHSSIGLNFLSKIGAIHKVNRLRGLVKDRQHDFSEFEHDIESTLTPVQKMFLSLNVTNLTHKELETFRVPTNVVRECKFIEAIYNCVFINELFESDLKIKEDPLLQPIVNVVNSFREEVKSVKLREVSKFINSMTQTHMKRSKKFLIQLEHAVSRLLQLDFTEAVKGMKPSEIKDFVNDTKKATVKKALSDPQLELCPFCGEQPTGIGYDGQPAVRVYVTCECGAQGPSVPYMIGSNTGLVMGDAITKWNEREE